MRNPSTVLLIILAIVALLAAQPVKVQAALYAQLTASLTATLTQTVSMPATTEAPPSATLEVESLTISGVEPAKISQLTGGSLSVYGSGFVTGAAVRLPGYGLLDTSVLNSNALRALVPPGLNAKRYDVEVLLPDGSSARLKGALRIQGPKEPTATATSSGAAVVFGQPQILIAESTTQPAAPVAGSPFTLALSLTNRGDRTATNLRVALASLDTAVPRGSSNLTIVDTLEQDATVQIELPLALVDGLATGYHNIDLVIDYSDYYGWDYTSQQAVGVNVGSRLSSQPNVLLAAYNTTPLSLAPGDTFKLSIELTNVGQREAIQLLLTLGGEDGSGLKPFAMIGAGNVKFVPQLGPGETLVVEHSLLLDGTASSGVYNLPVNLTYSGPDGEQHNENQVLNLLASRRPMLQINFYRLVEPGLVDQPMELPIELINIGRNLLNVSTVAVSGPNMQVNTPPTFIGALDGGTSGSVDVEVIPQASGSQPVLITINYLDDFNQPQVITETLSINVESPEPVPGGEGASSGDEGAQTFWDRVVRFLRGLFGLGS